MLWAAGLALSASLALAQAVDHATSPSADALAPLGIGKTLVVHLERATGRHEPLLEQAATQGIAIEVLAASDGRDARFRSYLFPSRHEEATCADIIGAIFDSHRRAWELASKRSSLTLVLEDDVSLPDGFADLLARPLRELPADFDIAFVGTSTSAAARPHGGSKHLLRPDEADSQAILGFWGYIVSAHGAANLLRLHEDARREHHGARLFQPVDLFIGHRLKSIKAYLVRPTRALEAEFERTVDRHHVIEGHAQVRGLWFLC